MFLQRLDLRNVRIIQRASLYPVEGINLIQGRNGAGKSSILEGIFLLATGRSFRTRRLDGVARREATGPLSVFGEVMDEGGSVPSFLGVERGESGTRLRVNGDFARSTRKLAERLSVLVQTPESHRLFSDGPGQRRALMDWAVFHVEHDFGSLFRRYHKGLQQRNAALREGLVGSLVSAWDEEIVRDAQRIDALRMEYVSSIEGSLSEISKRFLGMGVTLDYRRGWKGNLSSALRSRLSTDQKRGFTTVGSHRADLKFKIQGRDVEGYLSRGQSKLLVSALTLVQAQHLKERTEKRPVVLVDDLTAELSVDNQELFLCELERLGCQAFLTTLSDVGSAPAHLGHMHTFHVEQGQVMNML